MEDELINIETGIQAKQKGFNIPCWNYWQSNIKGKWNNLTSGNPYDFNDDGENYISQPTQALLQRWLRETYNIFIVPLVVVVPG